MYSEQCREEFALKVTQDQRQELAKFFSQVEQRAYRMARIETRNSGDALDLVQDAMESLMKRYAHHTPSEWRGLFYRILQNRIKDWHRWSNLRAKLHLTRTTFDDDAEDFTNSQPSSDLMPAEQLNKDLTMQRLQSALNQLSFRQRQTVLLRLWEGFDVKETATIMKCSTGSVKTHLSRATSTLKNILGEHYE